jgi:predicted MFS family arabinose efflux permease
MGTGMFAAGWVWPAIFGRLRSGAALAVLLLADTVAVGLLGLTTAPVLVVLAAVVFGGCVNSVVGGVTVVARRVLPPDWLLAGLSLLTVAFACGQLAGPVVFGVLSDRLGLRTAIVGSAAVLGAAAVAAWFQADGPVGIASDRTGDV